MIPTSVIEDCRIRAEEIGKNGKPKNWVTGAIIILVWLLLAVWIGSKCYKLFA
jgi:hypothetical protein